MYRYCVDKAVTYTSGDIVLFRESPFASWMERLTLENPDHGIPPDLHSTPPTEAMLRQDDLAEILSVEHKNVELIDWDAAEPERRTLTMRAMRRGVDFIVNGHLASGPLSSPANLLMRTSGYSELGNYLYVPCDTQAKTTLNSAFRLCFLADLLHSQQGQLPPQMLIIRGGSDIVPLRTEDHIYHYRAVKQRFMQAMREFRKHRMPDPAESAHFGRWADCANEVLRQRALRAEGDLALQTELEAAVAQQDEPEQPEEIRELQAMAAPSHRARVFARDPRIGSRGIEVGDTLAAQARALSPGDIDRDSPSALPGVNEAPEGEAWLEKLDFIGAADTGPDIGLEPASDEPVASFPATLPDLDFAIDEEPPAATDTGESAGLEPDATLYFNEPGLAGSDEPLSLTGPDDPPRFTTAPELTAAPAFPPPAEEIEPGFAVHEPVGETEQEFPPSRHAEPPAPLADRPAPRRPHPLDSLGFAEVPSVPLQPGGNPWPEDSPGARLLTGGHEFDIDCIDDSDYQFPEEGAAAVDPEVAPEQPRSTERRAPPEAPSPQLPPLPFSSSLMTSDPLDVDDD